MAFILPTFPITCDIYSGPWLTKSFRINVPCNLAPGRRNVTPSSGWDGGQQIVPIDSTILFPALTDVRDGYCAAHEPDVIECPAGSGRWYVVFGVDDFGKGFSNEHRYALVNKIGSWIGGTEYSGLDWPTPIP